MPIQIKLALSAGAALLIAFITWYATSDHYEKIIAQNQVNADKAVQVQLIADQKAVADRDSKIKLAETQHAQDQLNLNTLNTQLSGVQLHVVHRCTMPRLTGTSASANGGSGVAVDRTDEYLAEAQQSINAIAERCAQLNIDAIQLNNALKKP